MNLMKKIFTIAIFIFVSLFFISCIDGVEFADVSSESKQFVFKNYTDNSFDEASISLGEVIDTKIVIKLSEKVSDIPAKGSLTYAEKSSKKSVNWYFEYARFLKSENDLGCFMITLSDGRKMFIPLEFNTDPIYGDAITSAPNLFEIDITTTEFTTLYKTNTLKGIPVEDYEIIIN